MDQPDTLLLERLHVQRGEVHAVGEDAAGAQQAVGGQAVQRVLPAAVPADFAVGAALGDMDVQAGVETAADSASSWRVRSSNVKLAWAPTRPRKRRMPVRGLSASFCR